MKAVWDVSKAYRETTPTRERVCLNGLWRWQPADARSEQVPAENWGHFKVPACWPGITDYMQKDCQMCAAIRIGRASGSAASLRHGTQREITVPAQWAGRRLTVCVEYLNSYAAVYVDGRRAGEMRFPGGELDLTSACRPGGTHLLSVLVVALPLKGVMLHTDSASAREVKGTSGAAGLVWRRFPGWHAGRSAHHGREGGHFGAPAKSSRLTRRSMASRRMHPAPFRHASRRTAAPSRNS